MKIITGLSQSNLFLESVRNPIDINTNTLNSEYTTSVRKLIDDIKIRGDVAIKEITFNLDNVKLDNIEIDPNKILDGFNNTNKNLIDSLHL